MKKKRRRKKEKGSYSYFRLVSSLIEWDLCVNLNVGCSLSVSLSVCVSVWDLCVNLNVGCSLSVCLFVYLCVCPCGIYVLI